MATGWASYGGLGRGWVVFRVAVVVCFLLCTGLQRSAFSGTVQGVVRVKKEDKPRRPARYHLGPHRSGRRLDGPDQSGPQHVVVSLEGASGIRVSPAAPPPIMRQEGEAFVPHVLPILAGPAVEFPNKDDFYHNVFSVMSGDRFDLGRYARGESARQVFNKPGVVVVRCEIHAGMKAYIVVMETPYFTVPDSVGVFRLPDVPPGAYHLRAWHPTQGEQTYPVRISKSDTVRVDFSF